jgi:hypothetical protein
MKSRLAQTYIGYRTVLVQICLDFAAYLTYYHRFDVSSIASVHKKDLPLHFNTITDLFDRSETQSYYRFDTDHPDTT